MSWGKLLRHDLRCGLLRWRYLLAPLIFLLPCLVVQMDFAWYDIPGSWMDYLLYIFQGKEPITELQPNEAVILPMFWLMVVGGCLFLNLDYLLSDLTNEGTQVIVRGSTRAGWYLSKCVWNLCSCALYLCAAGAMTLLFTVLFGGSVTLKNTPALSCELLMTPGREVALTPWQGALLGIAAPYFTLAALSMLEMTLCLFVKPVFSFLACMAILVMAVYANTPFVLGNGAMAVRSQFASPEGMNSLLTIVVALAVILLCAVLGALKFRRTDILGLEE